MTPGPIDFYFDYLSPYAYFAWRRIPALAARFQRELKIHPVVFGKLLDHWGQLGPAEIPPKSKWLQSYCLRYAALNEFEFNPPKYHPFNPLAALRLSLQEVCGAQQHLVIQSIFAAGWSQGKDLGDLPTLISILESAGIDAAVIAGKINNADVKQLLIEETENAIALGVFGVPTMILDGQFFWGNDQLEHIELLLESNDPLDLEKLELLGSRPRKIDRKAVRK
ncbi:MAG: 2-hydroxychromene-2-carboxylate isomerase [Proteobacteria bacterium]|nr:2-hydroxychromene-2-carboxylate isomerase [Pseudomonadota bacterium]